MSSWPEIPAGANEEELPELRKLLFQGQIDGAVADAAAASNRELEEEKSTYALQLQKYSAADEFFGAFGDSMRSVIESSMERAREGARFVEKASTAIGGLYTALLGFVFSVEDDPLPSRAFIPAIFLGVAFVGAFAYLAFIKRPEPVAKPKTKATLRDDQYEQLWFFMKWVHAGVRNKQFMLRASVIALGCAVATLPLPLIEMRAVSEEGAPATVQSETLEWPRPTEGSGELALQKILYSAKVEVARQQHLKALTVGESPTEGVEDEGLAWMLFWGLLILVGVVPAAWAIYEKVSEKPTS